MIIANENELLDSVSLTLPLVRRALVLAPHPDDEVFGCGGTLCLLKEAGTKVTMVILTDGAKGGAADGLAGIREKESLAAAKVLGLPVPLFIRMQDKSLRYNELLIECLLKIIKDNNPDVVFLPALTEWHPDHQALAFSGAEALRRLGSSLQVAFYEVNVPLADPNLLLDITSVVERKQQAMTCFRTQLAEQPYDVRISGLNSIRAFFLGKEAVSAEAFCLTLSSDLGDVLPELFAGAPLSRKRRGFAVSGADFPLVSIIVRSMDRPTLARALDSLALQTWPNIEVVVVNSKGGEHRDLGKQCGSFPLRIINQGGARLLRSKAANVGLFAAQGKYLGFLDDDDTLDPEHVHTLTETIRKSDVPAVAYSGVRSFSNTEKILCFSEPDVGFAKLLMGNIIPIHACLFPASLLQGEICFDETIAFYEDWDFWLQVSREVSFIYTGQVTATYYEGGESSVGLGENVNVEVKQHSFTNIIGKWLGCIRPEEFELIGKLYHEKKRDWHGAQGRIGELQSKLALANRALAEIEGLLSTKAAQIITQEAQIITQEAQIITQEAQISAILASTSWRMTMPMRWCSYQLKRVRHFGCILPAVVRRSGGLSGIIVKGCRILRQEGLAGIRYRLVLAQGQLDSSEGIEAATHGHDYTEWVRRYDTVGDVGRNWMRKRLPELTSMPLISVIMPTHKANSDWLIAAIESVRLQIYPNWELCIADDASGDPESMRILKEYAHRDSRIKVVFRTARGHIAAASNSALELANGEWIALLDHDDLMSESALFWVSDTINRFSEAQLIYSDEDKIDGDGKRFDPYFKSDWNRDLFYSHNLITHLGVYKASLLREIGGFTEGMEGAQDYDLALRCIERIEPQQIYHIPRILYHWRVHPESTAQSGGAKPYAVLAGERALNEHFDRLEIAARAEVLDFGMYRVRYALPEVFPLVSLLIPTRNGLHVLRQCVESILSKTSYSNYEIIIIDNASDDPAVLEYFKELANYDKIRIVRDERPFNYSALNNAAVELARGELIGLINNDVEVITPDWLSEMVSHALRPGIGAVGARLWYPDDTSQHGGVIIGLGGVAGHSHKNLPKGQPGYFWRANLIQGLSAVTAACLVIAKKTYKEVGGFNEEELCVAFNDVDFCLRVREAGYSNIWTPYAELYHHESATRGYEDSPERQNRFAKEVEYVKKKWHKELLHDPAYSPNLTLNHEDFSFAWPPRVEPLFSS